MSKIQAFKGAAMRELAIDLKKDGSHENPKGMKLIVRFPRYIRRFPRLPAEDIAAQGIAQRLAELETKAFDWIARGHDANVQLGRVFLQMKKLIEYGRWEAYFIETFEPRGIPLRTGQHYMELANAADAVSAKIALFPPATDAEAEEINEATKEALDAVAVADKQSRERGEKLSARNSRKSRKRSTKVKGIGPYTLTLPLPGDTRKAMDKLRNSPDWDRAASEIAVFLRTLVVDYKIVAG
jgi:hypothetical protein